MVWAMLLSMLNMAKFDSRSSVIVELRHVLRSFRTLKLLSAVALLTGIVYKKFYTKYINLDMKKPCLVISWIFNTSFNFKGPVTPVSIVLPFVGKLDVMNGIPLLYQFHLCQLHKILYNIYIQHIFILVFIEF